MCRIGQALLTKYTLLVGTDGKFRLGESKCSVWNLVGNKKCKLVSQVVELRLDMHEFQETQLRRYGCLGLLRKSTEKGILATV